MASLSALDQIMLALGYLVLFSSWQYLYAMVILLLTVVSIRTGRFYFPGC